MTIETLWLFPVALVYILFFTHSPTSNMLENSWSLNTLLIAAGVITTVPLLLFTEAAQHLRLSTLGFFQYIGPTLMLSLIHISEPTRQAEISYAVFCLKKKTKKTTKKKK